MNVVECVEEEGNVRVGQFTENNLTHTYGRFEESKLVDEQQAQKTVNEQWIQVTRTTHQPKPTNERSRAQIFTAGRYDPIREVVEETQPQQIQTSAAQALSSSISTQRLNKGKNIMHSKPLYWASKFEVVKTTMAQRG
ncbi:hypothetical protein FRX31_025688 [Thalictrum thalictroides]|uniref:Uncharacterized protein n=1 Tax=Thalictrum thalictroides TaxID=46969 RepID=A0A7J6VKP4_THATH|nr:hypothetical protein FRX31_025688 [Thalictrum thalictroides]